MVLMKNATGNVYKNVTPKKVDDYLRKGFVIVEGGGGALPPPTVQDEKPEPEKYIEPVEVIVIQPEEKKLGKLYWNQLNKTDLRELMSREGIKFKEEDTVADLRKIYKRYLDSLKRKKKK